MTEVAKKRTRQRLLVLSGVLILAGTVGFGVTPFLDAKSQTYDASAAQAQLKYYDLRRQIDLGALQWELSRSFLVTRDILDRLGEDPSALARNQEHYHQNILGAWTFMYNAARGGDKRGPYDDVQFVTRPRRTDEEIQTDYLALVVEANKRNNTVLAEREQNRTRSDQVSKVRSIIHAVSLIVNCLGLAIGVVASKYD